MKRTTHPTRKSMAVSTKHMWQDETHLTGGNSIWKGERWSTWKVWQIWEQSPDADGLPRGPIKALLFLGFAFLFLQTVAELIRLGSVLAGKVGAESIEAPSGLEEILADQADVDLGLK